MPPQETVWSTSTAVPGPAEGSGGGPLVAVSVARSLAQRWERTVLTQVSARHGDSGRPHPGGQRCRNRWAEPSSSTQSPDSRSCYQRPWQPGDA